MKKKSHSDLRKSGLLVILIFAMSLTSFISASQADLTKETRQLALDGPTAFERYSPHVVPAAAFIADGYDPGTAFFPFSGGNLWERVLMDAWLHPSICPMKL